MHKHTIPTERCKQRNTIILAHFGTKIIETILLAGRVVGIISCPYGHLHNTDSTHGDTKAFFSGRVPWIKCHHESCQHHVLKFNEIMASMAGHPFARPWEGSQSCPPAGSPSGGSPAITSRSCVKADPDFIAPDRDKIIAKYPWPKHEVMADSPVHLDPDRNPADDWYLHVELFASVGGEGLVWLGHRNDSGWPGKSIHFCTAKEWLQQDTPVSGLPLTTPSLFAPGSYSRSERNVVHRPFWVVEHDELGHDDVLPLYRYLREAGGLNLRAIIDTANKSLHAWFDMPPEDRLPELEALLDAWGFDSHMKTASQPCRMAGAVRLRDYDDFREETWEQNLIGWQRLLYLNLKG